MPEPKNGPAPGNRGEATINAGKRSRKSSTIKPFHYEPAPGCALTVWLTAAEAEMLAAINGASMSRADLLMLRPRLALSAPQLVERLRRKGLDIETEWRRGTDRDGRAVRFGAYRLRGSVRHHHGLNGGADDNRR